MRHFAAMVLPSESSVQKWAITCNLLASTSTIVWFSHSDEKGIATLGGASTQRPLTAAVNS